MPGMPRLTARCLRMTVTASSMRARPSAGSSAMSSLIRLMSRRIRVISSSAGGGVGACPLVDAVDGGGEAFPGAEQVVEVSGQVGEVGDVGAEVVASGAAEADSITRGTSGVTPMAAIDWDAAITALHSGDLPCSGGERRTLLLSASLASGIPVSLRDTISSLDDRNVALVVSAIQHAAGKRP